MNLIQVITEIINNIKEITLLDLLLLVMAIVIFKIFSAPLSYIIVKMFNFKVKDKNRIKNNGFYKPLKTFFVLSGFYIAIAIIKLPAGIFYCVTKIFKIATILLAAKGFANLFNTNSITFEKFKNKLKYSGTDTTINFISKVIKTIIYIIAGFIVCKELGYDLNGLATGLGIGSVVIALAAQDLSKNIIGGFSIILDKPFEIGDYIETEKYQGTVEDITFRTIRIRDINNQIIIVPNSKIADEYLINGSKRGKRRYELNVTLELNTPLEKVAETVKILEDNLKQHENIIPDSLIILFDTISDSGIDLKVMTYTDLVEIKEYLKFKEEINYLILSILQKQGIELAYPSQSIYLKK